MLLLSRHEDSRESLLEPDLSIRTYTRESTWQGLSSAMQRLRAAIESRGGAVGFISPWPWACEMEELFREAAVMPFQGLFLHIEEVVIHIWFNRRERCV